MERVREKRTLRDFETNAMGWLGLWYASWFVWVKEEE